MAWAGAPYPLPMDLEPTVPATSPPTPAGAGILDRLGARAGDRPGPRFGVAIATGGAVMAVVGGVVIGGDQLGGDLFDSDPNKLPGILISLVTLVVGYALVTRADRDPLRAAGATAAALSLPVLLFFLTFDVEDLPPFSLDIILLGSTIGWAVAYLIGPSVGRPVFLGAALLGVWAFVLEQVEGLFSAPFLLFGGGGFLFGGLGRSGFDGPDATTVGIVCLLFGYGYLVAAGMLDARRLHGLATPFVVAGLFIVNNGYQALSEDLEPAGTGILIAATGLAIAVYFSRFDRRATTWLGGAGVALGVALVIGDVMEDGDPTSVGTVALIVGAVIVAAAELISRAMSEPQEFILLDDREPVAAVAAPPPPPPPPA